MYRRDVCAVTGLAPAAPFAYVPNEKSGTISIIDIATDTVTGVIPAGKRPRGIAISPDGKFIYVSDQPSNGIHVIDVAARRLASSEVTRARCLFFDSATRALVRARLALSHARRLAELHTLQRLANLLRLASSLLNSWSGLICPQQEHRFRYQAPSG